MTVNVNTTATINEMTLIARLSEIIKIGFP